MALYKYFKENFFNYVNKIMSFTDDNELQGIFWQVLGGYGVQHHFQQYFSYIMAVSFIGGGNRSTHRKPQTCHNTLKNLITYCCIKYTLPWAAFKLTMLVVIGTDCKGSWKLNYPTIMTMTAPWCIHCSMLNFTENVNYQKFLGSYWWLSKHAMIVIFPPALLP